MNRNISWWKVAAILFIVFFATWHPVTRSILWFLLPLGSGPDDLMAIGLIFLFTSIAVLMIRGIVHLPLLKRVALSLITTEKVKKRKRSTENESFFTD